MAVPALLLHWRGRGRELGRRRRRAAKLVRTIEPLAFRRRELLGRCVVRIWGAILAMLLLLLGSKLLGLLERLRRCWLLVWDRQDSLRGGLSNRLRHVWLLVRACLRLVGTVLRRLLGGRRGRLCDGRWWLVVCGLRCSSLLLLLPVCTIAIVCIQLSLVSRTGSSCSGSLLRL